MRTATSQTRNSNIELYRIIVMLLIVAHHYVVNSGISNILYSSSEMTATNMFAAVLGLWGKMGINCFVMITGWFMCKSNITIQKFIKLLAQVMFYKIVLFIILFVTGYHNLSVHSLKSLLPVSSINDGFVSCYIVFFLLIPFLNKLISNTSKKLYAWLLCLLICIYSILPSLHLLPVVINYVSWFSILYLIMGYLRIYGLPFKISHRQWGGATFLSMFACIASVIVLYWFATKHNISPEVMYYMVIDCNKTLALATALCSFMWIKDINIKQNRFINTIAASTFGVLLIHANSSAMRQWLWLDFLNCTGAYANSGIFALHAISSIVGVFCVCTFIDYAYQKFVQPTILEFFALKYDKIIERINDVWKS